MVARECTLHLAERCRSTSRTAAGGRLTWRIVNGYAADAGRAVDFTANSARRPRCAAHIAASADNAGRRCRATGTGTLPGARSEHVTDRLPGEHIITSTISARRARRNTFPRLAGRMRTTPVRGVTGVVGERLRGGRADPTQRSRGGATAEGLSNVPIETSRARISKSLDTAFRKRAVAVIQACMT